MWESNSQQKYTGRSSAPDDGSPGVRGVLFGLPVLPVCADVIVMPVEWGVTVSGVPGTHAASHRIIEASVQLDTYHFGRGVELGGRVAALPACSEIATKNRELLSSAGLLLRGAGENTTYEPGQVARQLDLASEWMLGRVSADASYWLSRGKKVCLLGGEHTVMVGLLGAVAEKYACPLGLLFFDAHVDMRERFAGLRYSHASTLHLALQVLPPGSKVVCLGARDISEREAQRLHANSDIKVVSWYQWVRARHGGSLHQLVREVVGSLPERVYVSVDVDVFDGCLGLCTGTPVAGGILYDEFVVLLEEVVASGREVVAADLCEANVRDEREAAAVARVLWELVAWMV